MLEDIGVCLQDDADEVEHKGGELAGEGLFGKDGD